MTMLDDLELELRKLPGVRAAGFDTHEDLLLIQLHVTAGDQLEVPLPVAATRIAARHSDRPVAVEIIRWRDRLIEVPAPTTSDPSAPPGADVADEVVSAVASDHRGSVDAGAGAGAGDVPPPPPPPPVASTAASTTDAVSVAPSSRAADRARLLAVLSFSDTDELEVHLDLAGTRSIGRAPASNGLAGAVEATVAAVRSLGADIGVTLEWVRAIDESANASLVGVCVRLSDDRQLYGMAAGKSPVDSATRATLDALNRHISQLLAS